MSVFHHVRLSSLNVIMSICHVRRSSLNVIMSICHVRRSSLNVIMSICHVRRSSCPSVITQRHYVHLSSHPSNIMPVCHHVLTHVPLSCPPLHKSSNLFPIGRIRLRPKINFQKIFIKIRTEHKESKRNFISRVEKYDKVYHLSSKVISLPN